MAIEGVQGYSASSKMLQIQNMQKPIASSSIFDVPKTEPNSSTIHSGHFMVSRVHEEKEDDDDEDVPIFSDDTKQLSSSLGYDFVKANKSTSQTYNFGPKSTSTLSIDASLTKLFECMTLAYSGKITSPKWKPFRGMHLTVKDKVRLNNIIWREWHMQYIFLRKSIVCQFATPLSDYIHTKPEAVVLEGKYWKRRLDTVTKEYKNWRRYYRDRILHQSIPEVPSVFSASREHLTETELLERVKDMSGLPCNVQQSSTDLSLLNADLMDMDFTDNLFSSLNQPFAFPNPRELGQMSCADLIQPGLVQLQPNLDDFMDIDTMQELLSVTKPPSASVFPPASPSNSLLSDIQTSMDMAQSQPFMQSPSVSMAQTVLGLLDPSFLTNGGLNFNSSNTAGINMLTALAALTSSANNTANNNSTASNPPSAVTAQPTLSALLTSDTHMVIDDPGTNAGNVVIGGGGGGKQALFSPVPQQGGFFETVFSSEPTPASKRAMASQQQKQQLQQQQQQQRKLQQQQPTVTFSLQSITPQPATIDLTDLQLDQSPSLAAVSAAVPSSSLSHSASVPTTLASRSRAGHSKTVKMSSASSKTSPRTLSQQSHMLGSLGRTQSLPTGAVGSKKDVFTIPQGKPAPVQRKPRTIAPAPSPPRTSATTTSAPMQSTYLAQLLTEGTYPGAMFNVKKEPTPSNTVTSLSSPAGYTPILPAMPSSNQRPLAPAAAPPVQRPFPTFTATPASSAITLPSQLTKEISKVTGVDFPTSVLLAAASSALGATSSNLKDAIRLTPTSLATAVVDSSAKFNAAQLASVKPKSPVPMATSPSPSPSPVASMAAAASPLAAVFSEALSPLPGMPSLNMSSFQLSSPSPTKDEDGFGMRVGGVHTEQRRVAHLSAEQKRRCNLKNGFDLLHTLVPALAQNPKVSKATMLQKTAEHCRKMKAERLQMQHEAAILKQEIESLNSAISVVQSQLPETGVPVTRQRVDQMKEMFEEYVKSRTLQNWKFWIFSIIIRNLFNTYNNMVSTSNMEELCRTTAAWLDQHCSLVSLRPTVLNALRHLSMTTSILTEPQRMREQATQAVTKGHDSRVNKQGQS